MFVDDRNDLSDSRVLEYLLTFLLIVISYIGHNITMHGYTLTTVNLLVLNVKKNYL